MANNEKSLKTNSEDEKEKSDLKDSYDCFLDSVKRSLVDLTSLEVNTVLVSNISADHPRSDGEFLRQTCQDLVEWFERNKTEEKVQTPLNVDYLPKLRELCGKDLYNVVCEDASGKIESLQKRIEDCLKNKKPDDLDEEQSRKHSEYRRHLRYLNKYLSLHKKWCEHENKKAKKDKTVFTDSERQQLRKLWELVGTEYVYAQTVMQLDGDIIARINDRVFSRDNAEELMRLHNRNVETGVNYRNGVMTTFFEIIKSLLGK